MDSQDLELLILSGPPLSRSHGTGSQMTFLLDGFTGHYHHLYWESTVHGLSEDPSHSDILEDIVFRWPIRGKQLSSRLLSKLGLSWWKNDRVNKGWLKPILKKRRINPDLIYCIIASEQEAKRACSLVSQFRKPYVVHLMDLQTVEGINPQTMPGWKQLLSRADHVFALSTSLAREARRGGARDVEILNFGRAYTPLKASYPGEGQPLKVVMVGSLQYTDGLELLAESWDDVKDCFPGVELHYCGREDMVRFLPDRLRSEVNYRGFFQDSKDLDKATAGCHLAYLPGPSKLPEEDCYSSYSIPSRLTDYLMLGLPVVANVKSESATGLFLNSVESAGVKLLRKDQTIPELFHDILSSREDWEKGSQRNREFALEHLDIQGIRERLFQSFREVIREG